MPPQAAGSFGPTARTSGHRWLVAALGTVTLLVFAAGLVVELRANARLGLPLDDPWIHLTFARNLAQGRFFVYNQGTPVAGSTAPLWTGLLGLASVFVRGRAGMVLASKLLAALFIFGAAAFAARIAARLSRSVAAGIVTGLAVATLSHFAWAMMSGMEVGLSAFLTMAGIWFYLAPPRHGGVVLPWVLLGMAAYARPESLVLLLFALGDVVVRALARRLHTNWWRGLIAYACTVAPLFALNLALSGSPFPQTYAAKAGQAGLLSALATGDTARLWALVLRSPWQYLWGFGAHLWSANPILAALFPVGLIALAIQAAGTRGEHGAIVPLTAVGYVMTVGLAVPLGGPGLQHGRYFGSVTALAVVVAVCGAALVLSRLRLRALALGLALVLASCAAYNAARIGAATIVLTAREASSINRMHVDLAEWLDRNTAPDAVLACSDIGAIGYVTGRRILDLVGIVTPEVAARLRRQTEWGEGHLQYVKAARPDYLVLFPGLFPTLRSAPFVRPVAYARVDDNYACEFYFRPRVRAALGLLVTGFSVTPRPSVMVVYACDWSRAAPALPGADNPTRGSPLQPSRRPRL